ncbi:hypothetical protein M1145_00510 [Patescibacteria group bacterium]|nr:hypothetical protein [Patescibacteria group bacterium]
MEKEKAEIQYVTNEEIIQSLNEMFRSSDHVILRLQNGQFTNPNRSSFTPKRTQGIYIERRFKNIYTVIFPLSGIKQVKIDEENRIIFRVSRGEHTIKEPREMEIADPEQIEILNSRSIDETRNSEILYKFTKDISTTDYYK